MAGFSLSWHQDQREDGCTLAANLYLLFGKKPRFSSTFMPCSGGWFKDHVSLTINCVWLEKPLVLI